MPTVSKPTTDKVNEFPVATDRSSDLDGYTVNFVDITETHSLAPLLASLPGGHCRCPHWGYLFQGRMIVHYDGHDEVIEQGQRSTCHPVTFPKPTAAASSFSSAPPTSFRRPRKPSPRACKRRKLHREKQV